MFIVQTVKGPIQRGDLGVTLLHEHIVFDHYHLEHPTHYDWDQVQDTATELLKEFATVGGRTYVDVTPAGNGRNPGILAEISRRANVNIIATTGFYADPDLMELVGTTDIDALGDLMYQELTQGMQGTTIRAGVIKVGTSAKMTRDERIVLIAAARAHRRTGVAIITHTFLGELAMEQVDILTNEGVNPNRIIVGHVMEKTDPEFHLTVARRGVNLGFDRLGKLWKPEDASVAVIRRLVDEGYLKQIVLSHDSSIYSSGVYKPRCAPGQPALTKAQKPRLTYINLGFQEKLCQAGIGQDQMQTMLVENPAKILAS